jgi:ribokinase
MKSVSLTVLGSINLDFVATAARLPRAGETIGGARLARYPGGKGANQALAARRLGAEVALIGAVGADAMAAEATALLRADGVDVSAICVIENEPTGVALIAVDAHGENQIIVAPGANAHVQWRLPRFQGALLSQLETPIAALEHASAAMEGFLAINLAPALPVPQSILQRANLLIVNENEAAFYGDSLSNTDALIAITYGARGAALVRGGKQISRVAPPRIDPVDTTGAGDAFCAGLTLALLEGQAEEAALSFACACGASAATRAGAQSSLPTRSEVAALLAKAG